MRVGLAEEFLVAFLLPPMVRVDYSKAKKMIERDFETTPTSLRSWIVVMDTIHSLQEVDSCPR